MYIDNKAANAAEALRAEGGAQVILATAPNSRRCPMFLTVWLPMASSLSSARPSAIAVTPVQLLSGSRSVQGWTTGMPVEAEDTLRFAQLSGVRPMIETYPLERAAGAYARMMSGKAELRVVLTM